VKKLLPILAISLCALLMLSLGRSPVRAAFPSDGDTFDYDFSLSMTGTNNTGSNHYDETIAFDMGVEFINHTDDYYWANHTMTFPDDPMFYPYNGTTIGSGACHYHPDNEAPLMFSVNYMNWSQLSYGWTSDPMFIEPGTQPGDELTFGSGYGYDTTDVGMYDEYPYADPYSDYYTQFTLPVGPGTPITVNGGTATLSTVVVGFSYEAHYNTSNPTYPYWDMTAVFNVSWEWSLGFLADVSFDIYMNLNPNYPSNYNLTDFNIEGGITITDVSTTDPIAVGPWDAVAPPIPGFPIAAVLMGLFAALVPAVLIRKRRK
jgi:hypothetical protein